LTSPIRNGALSELDEQRFGIRTVRGSVTSPDQVRDLVSDARDQGVRLLIVRCSADDLATAHALENAGGQLMDVLVYFARGLAAESLPADTPRVAIRLGGPGDAPAVVRIAEAAFRGYFGHYHADPRLRREDCDEVYTSWARRSCESEGVADAVLIAEQESEVVGFMTVRMNSAEEGEAVLGGVDPAAQGKGIYQSLLVRAMSWVAGRGGATMIVTTQISNRAVQRVWVRLGFEPDRAYLTFHVWLQ
jgi:GNAT superfamily N-acetyltransferase